MISVFYIEREFFYISKVEFKNSNHIWSVIGWAGTEIAPGAEFFCNPAHYGDSSKVFIVKEVFAYEKSLSSLPSGWSGRLHVYGPEGVDLQDWSKLYPKIPGIERLSDDFWKVNGHSNSYEIKIGDLVFFGELAEKGRDLIIDSLKPDVILVVEDILVGGEHISTIAPRQECILVLKGGEVQNIEDAFVLCW